MRLIGRQDVGRRCVKMLQCNRPLGFRRNISEISGNFKHIIQAVLEGDHLPLECLVVASSRVWYMMRIYKGVAQFFWNETPQTKRLQKWVGCL